MTLACWRVVVEAKDVRLFPIVSAETEDEARQKAVTAIRGAERAIAARRMHDSADAHSLEGGGTYRERDGWVSESLLEPRAPIERRRS